jgi:hypothetical protein
MKTFFLYVLKTFVLLIALQTVAYAQNTKEIFINANSGNDQSNGTKESPLRSLGEASRRANNLEGKGSITI